MEWLFLATWPSPVASAGWREGFAAALAVALPAALLVAAPAVVFAGAAALVRSAAARRLLAALAAAAPAAALALTSLLLFDNVTHTLLGFGITATRSRARHLYALLLALLFLVWLRTVWRWARGLAACRGARRLVHAGAMGVVLTAATAALTVHGAAALAPAGSPATRGPARAGAVPNVLFIGLDGVEADHLSLYGYGRPTSPFLERLGREALVFENAFPNGGSTAGSLASILTGRPPLVTGLVARPDALTGEAARRHLPGILKALGYRTALIAVREWADPVDLNLRGGFDWANSRRLGGALAGAEREDGRYAASVLGATMRGRLGERLLRIAGPRLHPTPFEEVTQPIGQADAWRLAELFAFVAERGGPFFAQIHLMETHGPTFGIRREHRLFARGLRQAGLWNDDFYDDAIRQADRSVAAIVGFLRRRELLDRTLVVVYSDHGRRHRATIRVPLLVRLPPGGPAGRIAAPVENLDIAPTVLDTLGLPAPGWMRGRSLLRRDLDACRWIVSASPREGGELSAGLLFRDAPGPTLQQLGLVTGLRAFDLEIGTGALTVRPLTPPASGGPACPEATAEQARAVLSSLVASSKRGPG